jgi:hypothetical protein
MKKAYSPWGNKPKIQYDSATEDEGVNIGSGKK